MTVRLSHSSLTGTERIDVAVGTVRDTSMFCAVRAGAPRRTVYVGSSLASAFAAGLVSLGMGEEVPLLTSAALLSGRGLATGAGALAGSGLFDSGFDSGLVSVLAAGFSLFWAGAAAGFEGAGAAFGEEPFEAEPLVEPLVEPLPWPLPWALKNAAQAGSTLLGSFWNWSNISSTSHSLAPKSFATSGEPVEEELPGDCGTA